MSHQSSDMGEPEISPKANGKKNHGAFVLYQRYVVNPSRPVLLPWMTDWHKVRAYASLEVAQEAKARAERKWGSGPGGALFEYKIEEKN